MTTALFTGDTPTEALIELNESSGPVSPEHQFYLSVTVSAGPSGLRLRVDDKRDWEGGEFRTKVSTDEALSRADYEALWADLLRLGVFTAPTTAAPEKRVGASLNQLAVRLGDQRMSHEYRLSELARKSRPPQAAMIERVRALAGR